MTQALAVTFSFFTTSLCLSDCEEGTASWVPAPPCPRSHLSWVLLTKCWLCFVDTGSSQMKSQGCSLKRAGYITALTTDSSITAKTTTIHLMRITIPEVSICAAEAVDLEYGVSLSQVGSGDVQNTWSLKYGAAQSTVEYWFSFVSVWLPGICDYTIAPETVLYIAVLEKDVNLKCCSYWVYLDLPLVKMKHFLFETVSCSIVQAILELSMFWPQPLTARIAIVHFSRLWGGSHTEDCLSCHLPQVPVFFMTTLASDSVWWEWACREEENLVFLAKWERNWCMWLEILQK